MALLQKKVTATIVDFFGGFVAKKVTTTMSSPSSVVVVLLNANKKIIQVFKSLIIFITSIT